MRLAEETGIEICMKIFCFKKNFILFVFSLNEFCFINFSFKNSLTSSPRIYEGVA